MSDVQYTHHFATPGSSLVDDVFYNEADSTLTVDLNDDIYRYSNVPKSVFADFKAASSAGRFYGLNVKRKFGPGEYVGNYDDVDFDRIDNAAARQTVGTPKDLSYATNAVVNYPPVQTQASSTTNVFSLVTPKSDTRRVSVKFEVDGRTKVHNLKAESVDEAVQVVEQIGDMLDLTFKVKEVTVYFE